MIWILLAFAAGYLTQLGIAKLLAYAKAHQGLPPLYVAIGDLDGTAMRRMGTEYYRDGGDWYTGYRRKGFGWCARSIHNHDGHLDGVRLVQISQARWERDNGPYCYTVVNGDKEEL